MSGRRRAYLRGHAAERRCSLLLRFTGWRILARRYRTPVGEIDLIAKLSKIVAAIEIKARRTLTEALEAVTPHQQRRIERAAAAFLSQHPKWRNLGFRFDVMAVTPWRLPKHVTDAWRPEAE
ncbi:MAG: YraN family protein [Pseudomonadota bacterium]|nr:YraN family protein [Pseudomonadota bacterium]